jgi:hypothetical protein
LIQADFLLSASREEIDASSLWNRALLENIPEAFRQAVNDFNCGDLRYTWIKSLQARSPFVDFFSSLEESTLQVLSASPIIESQSGELMVPSNLRTVPISMLGDDGQPIVPTELFGSKYISPKYPIETNRTVLLSLGIKDVTPEEFVDDLQIFITSSPQIFRSMPLIWHSRLCKILSQFSDSNTTVKDKVAELEIIPLRSGAWTSSSQNTLYFSDERNDDLQIPNGISMMEIDSEAASDASRRNLFMLLGARVWTKGKVCQAIISKHTSTSFNPFLLSQEDLISHVMFLFYAECTRTKPKCLWLVTESGAVKTSFDTYIDSSESNSASILFGQDRKSFSFIHGDYMTVPLDRQSELRDWMVANIGVAILPRLVLQTDSAPSFSEDFQYLLNHSNYASVLILLRDNWDHYAKWIIQKKTHMELTRQVREAVGNLSVSCRGGGSAKLKDTLLPTPNMEATSFATLPFLEIPDPEHHQWRELSHFGVAKTAGLGPFIKCLEILKDSDPSLDKASELYKHIYTQCSLDSSLIP